ncbi:MULTISPECIES: dephospho-CoA kinase [unclassified Mycoplasma]|uniref:dephospho-CoA kinase n=1 Tax=unclassified Mycoplasma TaxID=2683645 RepID=UPI00211BF666|nr:MULTISPECIES: dephospho-CoA kinase [unclassified Mycoplasma]UUM19582.1 dephospho-CoA kinase [Mycoplasma sp. 1578d]UUM24501.1 dephospho-CoA kinase [Mycoplasma sp. 3686d]
MIVISGKICSGKTTFLNQLENCGYKVFNCDQFVDQLYQNAEFIAQIQDSDLKMIVLNNQINKQEIVRLIKNNYPLFKKLEKKIHQIIYDHLNINKYDYVEVPVLKSEHVNFATIFSQIIVLNLDKDIRKTFCTKRKVSAEKFTLLDQINDLTFLQNHPFRLIEKIWLNSSQEIEKYLQNLPKKS